MRCAEDQFSIQPFGFACAIRIGLPCHKEVDRPFHQRLYWIAQGGERHVGPFGQALSD